MFQILAVNIDINKGIGYISHPELRQRKIKEEVLENSMWTKRSDFKMKRLRDQIQSKD
jgi:hypothetical protein